MDNEKLKQLMEQIAIANQAMTESLGIVAKSQTLFANAAKCYRNLYNELVNQGFSEEQALNIVTNYNPLKG